MEFHAFRQEDVIDPEKCYVLLNDIYVSENKNAGINEMKPLIIQGCNNNDRLVQTEMFMIQSLVCYIFGLTKESIEIIILDDNYHVLYNSIRFIYQHRFYVDQNFEIDFDKYRNFIPLYGINDHQLKLLRQKFPDILFNEFYMIPISDVDQLQKMYIAINDIFPEFEL